MVALVSVAQQAVVAGSLAALGDAGSVVEVLAGGGIEVADLERLTGDLSELGRVVKQASQHAGASLCRLVQEDL